MKDPQRWSESLAPNGFDDILASVDQPPELPSIVRVRVRAQIEHATAVPISPQLAWRAPVAGAVALALGGLLLWVFVAGKQEPVHSLSPDVAQVVDRVVEPAVGSPGAVETRIRVDSDPPGALIFLDDVERGRAPLEIATGPGEHVLRAQLADYEPREVRVRAARGERIVVALALAARDPEPVVRRTSMMSPELVDPFATASRPPPRTDERGEGRLVINTMPWTRVYIDGREVGNTPLRVTVSAGQHRIRLVAADGRVESSSVHVRAGQTHRFIRRLREASSASPDLVDPFADR